MGRFKEFSLHKAKILEIFDLPSSLFMKKKCGGGWNVHREVNRSEMLLKSVKQDTNTTLEGLWQHGMSDLFLSFDLDWLEDQTFQLMSLTRQIIHKQANKSRRGTQGCKEDPNEGPTGRETFQWKTPKI